ncbi:CatB-related O-acetyltransferase [uncultured Lacinutrix sp.]|uniref:CatB-related O-acetyltransferase n=1 Tax=Lacinutrix sp. MedPE-SW TaxID=1860087 RepID=UPI000914BA02|nr:MAG: hypothetical protein BM549_02770 [Lacinutrix sp. MedPE-SW]
MKSYLKSFISPKKIFYKNISFLAYWSNDSTFSKHSEIRRFAKLKSCKIGKYSRVNPNSKFSNVTVGNFTAIGRDTTIGLGKHPLNYVSTQNIFYKKNNMNNQWVKNIDFPAERTYIGNDVWIGVEAMILDGVVIGDGAVIGARSVVTKDIPPYAIAVGSPAKVIKYRLEKEVIERLLEIKWWDFTDEKISEKVEFFREKEVTIDVLNKYFPKEK